MGSSKEKNAGRRQAGGLSTRLLTADAVYKAYSWPRQTFTFARQARRTREARGVIARLLHADACNKGHTRPRPRRSVPFTRWGEAGGVQQRKTGEEVGLGACAQDSPQQLPFRNTNMAKRQTEFYICMVGQSGGSSKRKVGSRGSRLRLLPLDAFHKSQTWQT